MKKRIISSFLALLIFALLLLIAQKAMFGQIVSFSTHAVYVQEEKEKTFECNIISIEKNNPFLKSLIECQDFSGKDQNINFVFSYPGIAKEQATFKEQNVILERNSKSQYSFNLPYPKTGTERTLQLKATNSYGETSLKTQKMIISRSITGNAISESIKQQLPNIPILIISLIALLLATRFIINHHKRTSTTKHFKKRIRGRLIELNLDLP
jgi:hypothetical protein